MKILLICYYFPPCGGAAVQRWLRFLPHLVEHGCQITVVTPGKVDYPVWDGSLLKQIPEEVRVIRTSNINLSGVWSFFFGHHKKMPYGSLEGDRSDGWLMRIALWLRVNLIIPDIRILGTAMPRMLPERC